ncbi:MAG: CapA family protein, partial [Planctomycetes bacterium]|nr:CapA family protein [Planctomycetota bacterium]
MKILRFSTLMIVLFLFCFLVGDIFGQDQKPVQEMTVLLAGDAIITQPWSEREEPEFLKLVEAIRGVDAAIVNLEMLIHDFEGYAQADSGGTYMGARPVIAKELAWAGFDVCGNANNHTFDYGSIGVLKTVEHVTEAGMLIAGSGKDLQTARAPVIYTSAKGKVALVSCASTFTAYGKASRSRPDIHGRPGLNPLTLTTETVNSISRK